MKRSLILLSTSLMFLAFSNILQAQDIAGTWYNTEKSGKIKIFKQGNAYFGEIVWLEEPNDENGKPKNLKVKKPGNELDYYEVDGISGATFTGNGVAEMLERSFVVYHSFFDKNPEFKK